MLKNMKAIKIKIFFFFMLLTSIGFQSKATDISANLISAFKEGDAQTINAYLAANVEIAIGTKNDVFSKQQATGIINEFFRENSVKSFQVVHRGSKDAANFIVGSLATSRGTYRVHLLMRMQGTQAQIQQLRIEESNE